MDLLGTIRDLSILGAAMIAIYATGSWRRELKAKKQIELAEETLTLFYEAADAIRVIRYPGSYGSETSSRISSQSEDLKRKEAHDKAFVLIRRYLKYKDVFNSIHSMRYRFMVQFGKESAEPFDKLHRLVKGLLYSARRLAEIWTKDSTDFQHGAEEKYAYTQEQYEAIFWEKSEDDEVNSGLNSIIRRIEDTCRFIILSNSTSRLFHSYSLPKLVDLVKKKRSPGRSEILAAK